MIFELIIKSDYFVLTVIFKNYPFLSIFMLLSSQVSFALTWHLSNKLPPSFFHKEKVKINLNSRKKATKF